MSTDNNSRASRAANTLIVIAILLFSLNLIGLYQFRSVTTEDPYLMDSRSVAMSEQDFWKHAYRHPGEPLETYLERLTRLVSEKMLRIDPQHTKPTLFENWILWLYAKYIGYYEWSDTRKAVRLGGGFCSQNAIVFNNLLREQDIESRIIKLGGHVLNEVLVDDDWRVYDSDFNVVFDASLNALERDPESVYRSYVAAGRPEAEAEQWKEIFASSADNWHYKKTENYRGEKFYIEAAALYLVWLIPGVLLISGIAIRISHR